MLPLIDKTGKARGRYQPLDVRCGMWELAGLSFYGWERGALTF